MHAEAMPPGVTGRVCGVMHLSLPMPMQRPPPGGALSPGILPLVATEHNPSWGSYFCTWRQRAGGKCQGFPIFHAHSCTLH